MHSYLASGPPSPRLAELLALSQAGVLQFLGADARFSFDADAGVFLARSASVDGVVEARAMVEARVPAPSVAAPPDELVTSLVTRGEAAEKVLADPAADGAVCVTGRLHVDAAQRVMSAIGQPKDRLFAVGFRTSGAQVAAFAERRPGPPRPDPLPPGAT